MFSVISRWSSVKGLSRLMRELRHCGGDRRDRGGRLEWFPTGREWSGGRIGCHDPRWCGCLGGGFPTFCLATMIAGGIQIALGLMGAGTLARYFPTSVIKGMLAAIGIIIMNFRKLCG